MSNLVLNGHSIDEIAEIAEFFDAAALLEAWADGTLQVWLDDRNELEILEQVRQIKAGGQSSTIKVLVEALGLDYDAIRQARTQRAADEKRQRKAAEEERKRKADEENERAKQREHREQAETATPPSNPSPVVEEERAEDIPDVNYVDNPWEFFDLYMREAQKGNAEAQYALGVCYDENGPRKKSREAVKWFRLAAEQGHAFAQCELGEHLLKGDGVSPDPAEAMQWFRKAARQGDPLAMSDMGVCYLIGTGVRENRATGINWLRKAGEQGDEEDKIRVGNIFGSLVGDPEEAEEWFRRAMETGDAEIRAEAQEAIDALYDEPDSDDYGDDADDYGNGDDEYGDEDDGFDGEDDGDDGGDDGYGDEDDGGYGGGGGFGGGGYGGGGGILDGLRSGVRSIFGI